MAIAFASPGFRTASEQELSDAQRRLDKAVDKIGDLQAQVDRLLLITESMWFVLKGKLQLDDAALMEMMNQVDMRDGKLDGKVTAAPQNCPVCNHSISVRTGQCFYCGAHPARTSPF
jgi:hypothetical protein